MKSVIFVISLWSAAALAAPVAIDQNTGSTSRGWEQEGPARMTARASEPSSYLNALALRDMRHLGAGVNAAGALGMVGVQGTVNLEQDFSLIGGFGGGQGYRSFTFQMRRYFSGTYLIPYVSGGFSRWYSSSTGPVDDTTPGFLRDSFLSQRAKESGNFGENIVFPAAGIEYVQLRGPYMGLSLYAEVIGLLDLNRLIMAPTGGLGANFYF